MADEKYARLRVFGGRNGGPPPSDIEDVQLAECLNWVPRFDAHLEVRSGYSRITASAYAEALTSLFSFSADAATRTLVAGTATGLAKLSGDALVAIPVSGGATYTSSTRAWQHRQYNRILYSVRPSTGTMKRSDLTSMQDAGIDAPPTAPTLADGGTGTLDAADYYGVYTYYNENTGAESNPSPVSSALTLGSSKLIDWSALVPSTNPQVTHIRLYRTLPDQQGQYFFVDSTSNFSTTYADDNDAIEDLGDRVSFRNGTPPANVELMEVFQDRMFLSDGIDLFFSEIGLMESFAAANLIKVFPNDGFKITQLLAFGSRLIIGKGNAVHFLTGSDRDTFALRTLSDRDGCLGDSMRTASGFLFWFTGTKVIQSQGSGVADISSSEVEDLIKRLNVSAAAKIQSGVVPSENLYLLHLPLDSATTPSHTLAYNWITDKWHVRQYNTNTEAPIWADLTYSSTGAETLYGIFSGSNHVVDLLDGDDDNGLDIVAQGDGKAFTFDEDGREHGIRGVGFLSSPAMAGSMAVALIRNEESSAYISRSVSTNSAGWKPVSLSSMDRPASLTQVRFTYTGKSGLKFNGLAMKVIQLGRTPSFL